MCFFKNDDGKADVERSQVRREKANAASEGNCSNYYLKN